MSLLTNQTVTKNLTNDHRVPTDIETLAPQVNCNIASNQSNA